MKFDAFITGLDGTPFGPNGGLGPEAPATPTNEDPGARP
jgi:hypothetical protein